LGLKRPKKRKKAGRKKCRSLLPGGDAGAKKHHTSPKETGLGEMRNTKGIANRTLKMAGDQVEKPREREEGKQKTKGRRDPQRCIKDRRSIGQTAGQN